MRAALKLSSRQRDFLSRLLDLHREAKGPVHYANVARALDVRPVTAYEMLRLLEDKGLARSEAVRPQGHRGRSVVVFSPTEKATTLLAKLTGNPLSEREWEEAKASILQALEKGRGTDHQILLNELLLRIPGRQSLLLIRRRYGDGRHPGLLRTAGPSGSEGNLPRPAPVRTAGMGSTLSSLHQLTS